MFESFHLSDYYGRIIGTIILIIILYVIRFGMSKIILKFSAYSEKAENRSKLIIKYINSTLSILFLIFLIILWGVDTKSLFGFMGAAVTFIGVALFAQWSVLSNFTDRKSTRLNSSHVRISYAVFCLKKKIPHPIHRRRAQEVEYQLLRLANVVHDLAALHDLVDRLRTSRALLAPVLALRCVHRQPPH